MTEASRRALDGLRDFSTLQWYVIPLLAIVFYIYTSELKKARTSGNWDAVLCGLTVFGMDFIWETWNGWVFAIGGRSALWTAPGPTALRTTVGWNIEIMFMFALAGIVYHNTLRQDRDARLLGLPDRWFWAIAYAAFCVFVECFLNYGGHLIWEYPFWNRSLLGVWPIFLFGYFQFFLACVVMLGIERLRTRVLAVSSLYATAIAMNVFGFGIMGWTY